MVKVAPPSEAALPFSGGWWWLFAIELPIVAATLGYWLLAPASFLGDVYGIEAPEPGVVVLLRHYAAAVGSMVLWLYARLLWSPAIDLRGFRLYQEALLVGDVGVVVVALGGIGWGTLQPAAWGAVGMATLWGVVRVVFLRTHPLPDARG